MASLFQLGEGKFSAALRLESEETIVLPIAGRKSRMIKPACGPGGERKIDRTKAPDDILPNSWSPEDKFVLWTFEPVASGSSLLLVDVATGKSTPFIANKASVTNGIISPDGQSFNGTPTNGRQCLT